MAHVEINSYFTPDVADDSEHDMVSDLIAEAVEITGVPSYYLPFNDITVDLVLDEAISRSYTEGYKIPVYVAQTDDAEFQNDLMTKFGIEYSDDYNFLFAIQHFNTLQVPDREHGPSSGDLLYIPILETLYTINSVPHRNKLAQLGQRFVWQLKSTPYSPSMDDIVTTNDDINTISDSLINFTEAMANNQNDTSSDIGDGITIATDDPFGDY